uniref:Major facilitator superfamily (MFS) profile domain-containing protein n=1 Tax=Panagrolaimus sp. PS1159 TaxID=55785 RepID=A0AC35EZS8_9BILA
MDTFGRKTLSIYFRAGFGFAAVFLMLFGKVFLSIESFAIGGIFLGATLPISRGITRYYISECSPDKTRGFITQAIPSLSGLMSILYAAILLPQFLGNDERWHFTLYI